MATCADSARMPAACRYGSAHDQEIKRPSSVYCHHTKDRSPWTSKLGSKRSNKRASWGEDNKGAPEAKKQNGKQGWAVPSQYPPNNVNMHIPIFTNLLRPSGVMWFASPQPKCGNKRPVWLTKRGQWCWRTTLWTAAARSGSWSNPQEPTPVGPMQQT